MSRAPRVPVPPARRAVPPPAPPPLTAEEVENLDTTFRARALEMIREAEKGAKRKNPGTALKAYWHDTDFKGLAAETAVKAGANVGAFFAGTAIVAAGVAAGAVTFGIAPAMGVVAGVIIGKSANEIRYQRASKRLRLAIKGKRTAGAADSLSLTDLPDAWLKVLKKYLRVTRRAKMLLGGARGVAYALRHAKTAIKAQFGKHKAPAGSLSTTYDDRDLNESLLELRYYGQMTFNAVNHELDQIVEKRNRLLEQAHLTYAHIVRQVHFTGNHKKCGIFKCWNISQDEFRRNLRAVRPPTQQSNFVMQAYRDNQHFNREYRQARGQDLPLLHAERHFNPNPPIEVDTNHFHIHFRDQHSRTPGQAVSGTPPEGGLDRGLDFISNTGADVTTGFTFDGVSKFGEDLGASQVKDYGAEVGKAFGEGLAKTAAGTPIAAGVDLLFGFVKERIVKRMDRSRVLGTKKDLITLLEHGNRATQEEVRSLGELLKSNDKGLGTRVAEKILWYVQKIAQLEAEPAYQRLQAKVNTPDFRRSVFAKCDEAYDLWYATHNLLRQYNKLITNMVFLEVILLQTDRKVGDINIGVPRGAIIRDGADTPPRPTHMRADG